MLARAFQCLAALTTLFAAGVLSAADVRSDVSTKETYVGLPIVLRVQINNSVDHEPPEVADVDGLKIESAGAPSRGSNITIINGRRTERTSITYAFRVTPLREGTFTIPPIKIVADGRATITKAMRIVASKSETDDLMLVEIAGKENEIYVGQPVELTLKIWIRPYRDQEFQVELSEGDTWNLISEQSSWGAFGDSMEEMAEQRQRPRGRQVLREDSEGNERAYYLFEVDAMVYPDRPGRIDADDVRVIANYPVQLGRSRSPFSMLDDDDFFGGSGLFDDSFFRGFGSSVGITKSRPIVAEAMIDPIVVKPIPEKDRPEDYRGAVGRYEIITEANPTQVKVGDPITLHIGIRGKGSMDRLRAPPLERQADLIRDFKVPDQPLAGIVDESRKIFSTTLRPVDEKVTEIPPITFSYFDPETERFVTTKSNPIPIQVEPADVLAIDALAGGQRSRRRPDEPGSPPEPVISEAGIFSDDAVLKSQPRASLVSGTLLWMIMAPPLIALLAGLFTFRHRLAGLISARRHFRSDLQSAQTTADVAAALERFLAARFRLDGGRLVRDQTVGGLRAAGHHDLAIRTERLYAQGEKARYRSPDATDLETLKREADQIVAELAEKRSRRSQTGKASRLSSSSAIGLVVVFVPPLVTAAASADDSLRLTPQQQVTLLQEAADLYASASKSPQPQAAYARAADQFQLLVDSGIENDRLYFNLASARKKAGQRGRAIANYRRALRLNPQSQLYHQQLASLESDTNSASLVPRALAAIRLANDQLLSFVTPGVMRGLFVASWAVSWGIVLIRLLGVRFAWKSAAVLTLAIALLASGSWLVRVQQYTGDDMAVLVRPDVSLREGDGEEFAEIRSLDDAEGRLVQVLDRRSGWFRVDLGRGTSGWLPANNLAEI